MARDNILNDIMKKLEDHEHRISILERMPERAGGKDKKLSIKEFILTRNPVDDIQKTLVIGYYLEHFGEMSTFNVRDLTEGFRAAREPVPANINDKVNANIAKAYMMPVKEKKDKLKAWMVTNSGERFIEEDLKADTR